MPPWHSSHSVYHCPLVLGLGTWGSRGTTCLSFARPPKAHAQGSRSCVCPGGALRTGRRSLSLWLLLVHQAEAEDGLLLYCGESEHERGDFMALAIIRRSLQFR